MPKHMVHPLGHGIAQNTEYEEMIIKKIWCLYKLEIRSKIKKKKRSDNFKIEKGLKTTQKT